MSLRGLLNRCVAPAVRERFWRLLEEPARWDYQRHLTRIVLPPRGHAPAVHYGADWSVGRVGIVHGGRVKLQHLAEEFPPVADDFNLLYLVSSAPPPFALELVKWAKKRGVKFVWNQNGVAYPAWSDARSEAINGPMRALRQQADFIFCQSEFCRQCAERFLGPADVPGEIAFNCVDTVRYRPGPPPAEAVCKLLAAGSHYERYRVFSVLETAAVLVRRKFPVALHLAGRLAWQNAAAEVAKKIRDLGIAPHVRQTAAYRQDEAPAIYQAAHILLHPKYKDPCPTVPIEAMACGVPVIGSASGGLPEIVDPAAGVLLGVPESWEENYWPAPAAMADAVETIMRRFADYRAAARTHAAAHFGKETWVAKHRRVFQELVPA